MDNDAIGAGASIVTAALIVIGDEILSGRTKDKNIGHIADHLTGIGIQLKEVRIVPDDEEEIIAAVNALRARHHYVFTTGGIGPTHDDITADSIAKAFGVGIDVDERSRVNGAERLWAVGPLTKGALWEIVAVPDIRGQVADVANDISEELGR